MIRLTLNVCMVSLTYLWHVNDIVHTPKCFPCGNPGQKYENSAFWKEASSVV